MKTGYRSYLRRKSFSPATSSFLRCSRFAKSELFVPPRVPRGSGSDPGSGEISGNSDFTILIMERATADFLRACHGLKRWIQEIN